MENLEKKEINVQEEIIRLKAMAYDAVATIERNQKLLQAINQKIAELQQKENEKQVSKA